MITVTKQNKCIKGLLERSLLLLFRIIVLYNVESYLLEIRFKGYACEGN